MKTEKGLDNHQLAYDTVMDGEDVVMSDANTNQSSLPPPENAPKQRIHTKTIVHSSSSDEDDGETLINVRISKKKAEMLLAAQITPDRRSKRPSSSDCQCNTDPPSHAQQQKQQQQRHYHQEQHQKNYHYHYYNQYHHHYHHHYHYQPYFHYQHPSIPLYHANDMDPVLMGPSQNQICEERRHTELVGLRPSTPSTLTTVPTNSKKKRPRSVACENDRHAHEDEPTCQHKDHSHSTLKKQKHQSEK